MNFPFRVSGRRGTVYTLTLEEAIAYARHWADAGTPWEEIGVGHDDGRRWYWEIKRGKPHLVEVS